MAFASPNQNTPRWQALVAEDSVIHQRLASSILKRRGFQVTIVNNGREAVVASRDFAFDLILMDVEMPVLDGCAATRQIRAQELQHGLHVPIVAVTSLDDRERVLRAGMDSFISKPLSATAFDHIVQQLVAAPACC